MQNSLVWIKIKERLNKRDSSDYDYFHCWQIREAYNKAQLEWVRRQIHGINQTQEGDEESRQRVDDLQILITKTSLLGKTHNIYFETEKIPANYLAFKRITPIVTKGKCEGRRIKSTQKEESNVDELLKDWSTQPSFDFEETFHTMADNKIKVYTNNDFIVNKTELIYYRKPRELDFGNCEHQDASKGRSIDPEFKDDIVELIIDDAVSILAGDIESPNQVVIPKQRTEQNN